MLRTPSPCPDRSVTGIPSVNTGGVCTGFFTISSRCPAFSDRDNPILRLLSGRTHEVVTVLSVCKGSQLESEAVVTKVTFRTLCEEELRAYVRTGEPMDKAGSYGIQGYGAMFVSRIEGDYFSVMGLPLCPLCRMLRAFGVPILDVQEAQA